MKISTKSQYALEALIDLHLHSTGGQESLRSIAGRRDISEHYLEQIFATLRKAGIVTSSRGAQGGYRLAAEPADITAGSVIRALEGPLCPVKCVHSGNSDEPQCPLLESCATRMLWVHVTDEIDSIVDTVTLEGLISSYESLSRANAPEYCI